MATTPLHDLASGLAATGALVGAVGADQWSLPTPCDDWDVAALVRHLAGGNRAFAAALRHGPPPSGSGPDDPPGAYRDSVPDLLEAFGRPGALEHPVTVPFGTVPGAVALELRLTEVLTHGWDLARATGQTPAFPDALAERALAFSQAHLGRIPPDRRPFGPQRAVDPAAPAIDRLAACLGRDPDWKAAPA